MTNSSWIGCHLTEKKKRMTAPVKNLALVRGVFERCSIRFFFVSGFFFQNDKLLAVESIKYFSTAEDNLKNDHGNTAPALPHCPSLRIQFLTH